MNTMNMNTMNMNTMNMNTMNTSKIEHKPLKDELLYNYINRIYGEHFYIMRNLIIDAYFHENTNTFDDFSKRAILLQTRKTEYELNRNYQLVQYYSIDHLEKLLFNENGTKKFTK